MIGTMIGTTMMTMTTMMTRNSIVGKLHTLKRAIERDPQKWIVPRSNHSNKMGKPNSVHGARFIQKSGVWEPITRGIYVGYGANPRSYMQYVVKILKELGYNVTMYGLVL